MIDFALAISHTPWIPSRVKSMARLGALLFPHTMEVYPCPVMSYRLFDEKAFLHVWAGDMWRWGARCETSHVVFLQDDLIVPENFWDVLSAIVSAAPNEIIGLETIHPFARTVARNGGRWCTTADGLVGCGYLMPRSVVSELCEWRTHRLRPEALEPDIGITEDCLINIFAMDTGRRIFHPIPTIIRPDLGMASTYGNDHHPFREPSVTWEDGPILRRLDGDGQGWGHWDVCSPQFWDMKGQAPAHFGIFYTQTFEMARRFCRSWDESKHAIAQRDLGPQSARKWVIL